MIVEISDQPTSENIQNVVRYLEIFRTSRYASAEGESEWGGTIFSDETSEFILTLSENKMIVEYDWPHWREQAAKYEQDEALLANAGLNDLRKLLTYHLRHDRFSEGWLLAVLQSGHVTAILERLARLEPDPSDKPE